LNEVATISRNIEELYLAFNHISDVSDLMGMEWLRVLDLEANDIADLSNLRYLTWCPGLKALTLAGNPGAADGGAYVRTVAECISHSSTSTRRGSGEGRCKHRPRRRSRSQ
jgi:hypothetical protein